MQNTIPAWAEQLVVLDTETTGVSVEHSRIVTATIALLDSAGAATERYDWLINPGIEIPEAAARVHGITTQMASESGINPDAGVAQIINKMLELINLGFPLVVYNAPFDLSIIKYESERYGLDFPNNLKPVLDPLVIDKKVDRFRRGKRTLEAVSAHYGVELLTAHDAGADAIAAGQVLQAIAHKHKTHLPSDVQELHEEQVRWAASQAESFADYMRRTKDPSFVADGRWPIK